MGKNNDGARMDLQFEAFARMALATVLAFAFWRRLVNVEHLATDSGIANSLDRP